MGCIHDGAPVVIEANCLGSQHRRVHHRRQPTTPARRLPRERFSPETELGRSWSERRIVTTLPSSHCGKQRSNGRRSFDTSRCTGFGGL